jgi:class 3 adenylate cyclase
MYEVGACPVWDSAWVSADPAPAPSGVVTFLFTDIEGSTRRWEADAAAMRAALLVRSSPL